MEHQVIVHVPVRRMSAALHQPDLLARCVPGFLPDTAEDPSDPPAETPAAPGAGSPEPGAPVELSGRLKVRFGSTTITFRGVLRLTEETGATGDGGEPASADGPAEFAVHAEGEEVRGGGTAKLDLRARLEPEGGDGEATRLTVTGSATGGGRFGEASAETVASTGQRLLERFAAAVEEEAEAEAADGDDRFADADDDVFEVDGDGGRDERDDDFRDDDVDGDVDEDGDEVSVIRVPDSPAGLAPDGSFAGPGDPDRGPVEASGADLPELEDDGVEEDDEIGELEVGGVGGGGEEELDLPFPSEEFFESADAPDPAELAALGAAVAEDDAEEAGGRGPAHRRTMVGRSAEEVDHAPPRGRYAPVPVPVPAGARKDWRWAAVGAFGVVAGSVVVYRVLRSRR